MANENGNNLVTQGRILWCIGSSVFEGKGKTEYGNNNPKYNKDGTQSVEYGFGLAILKYDANGQPTPEFTKLWAEMHKEAYTLFPNGNIPPAFAMKYKDGDTAIDDSGKKYSDREGYAGHIVLACTTQVPIKFFKFEGGNNILVNSGIKCGDYVNVQLNIKAHPAVGQGKAGLYMNPSAVQLIQSGKEIINTPSGDQLFGQQAPAYNGQVIAGTTPAMPGQVQPPSAPVYQQPPMQQAPANYAVLPQNMQPPSASVYQQPPMQQAPQGNYVAPQQVTAPIPPQGNYAPTVVPFNGQPPGMPPMPR